MQIGIYNYHGSGSGSEVTVSWGYAVYLVDMYHSS
jgi:hypothetical protein